MIISNAEIARVLELVRHRADEWPKAEPLLGWCDPTTEDLSLRVRLVLIKSLQEMLAAGMYEIPPELVAEKIIGRAICDQVRHCCDDLERDAAAAR
jgi:hypothetical protein